MIQINKRGRTINRLFCYYFLAILVALNLYFACGDGRGVVSSTSKIFSKFYATVAPLTHHKKKNLKIGICLQKCKNHNSKTIANLSLFYRHKTQTIKTPANAKICDLLQFYKFAMATNHLPIYAKQRYNSAKIAINKF